MTLVNDYYTYAYLRRDGSPYYVGRGKGNRAYVVHRSGKKRKFAPPPRDRILFLKQNLSFEESVQHEVYMISVLGRKDLGTGILRNLTDGGEGSSNRLWSSEEKERLRQVNLGKKLSQAHREKIRQAHQGRPWSEARRNAHKQTEESCQKRSDAQRKRREMEKELATNVLPSVRGRNHHTLRNDPLLENADYIFKVWEENGRPKDHRTLCRLLKIPRTKKVMSIVKLLSEENGN